MIWVALSVPRTDVTTTSTLYATKQQLCPPSLAHISHHVLGQGPEIRRNSRIHKGLRRAEGKSGDYRVSLHSGRMEFARRHHCEGAGQVPAVGMFGRPDSLVHPAEACRMGATAARAPRRNCQGRDRFTRRVPGPGGHRRAAADDPNTRRWSRQLQSQGRRVTIEQVLQVQDRYSLKKNDGSSLVRPASRGPAAGHGAPPADCRPARRCVFSL